MAQQNPEESKELGGNSQTSESTWLNNRTTL